MAIKLKLELKWTNIKRVGTIPRGLNLEDFSDYSYDYGDGWEIVVSRMADSKGDEIVCEKTVGTNAMRELRFSSSGCLIVMRGMLEDDCPAHRSFAAQQIDGEEASRGTEARAQAQGGADRWP